MSDIATHVRIFCVEPTDELVEKRTAAIDELVDKHVSKLAGHDAILKGANDLAMAIPTNDIVPQLAEQIEAAIKKQSPAFVRNEHELEMLVCGLLALLRYLTSTKVGAGSRVARPDLLAAAIWSALSFQRSVQKPKLEALRVQLMETGRTRVLALAETSRLRGKVPEFASVAMTDGMDLATFQKSLKPAIDSVVNVLRTNAILDREEIDLLWWALGDWSELMEERLSAMAPEALAVAAGIEIGRRLRRFPANAHRYLALRHVNSTADLSLVELIKSLGERRKKFVAFAGIERVSAAPAIFPLLFALETGEIKANGAKEKRSLRDWSARALLEASLLHVLSQD